MMSSVPPFTTIAPDRARLETILGRRDGLLDEDSYPLLLLALAAGERSAVLTLRRNILEKAIVFDGGVIIDCYSNIATETLGRFLVAAGRISEADHHACLAESGARRIPFEDLLTEKKLLSPTDLFRVMQQNLGRNLLDPFGWTSGSWEIFPEAPPVESSLRVRVPQLIVTAMAKVALPDEIETALADSSRFRVTLAAEPLVPSDDLRLSHEQQTVLESARTGVSVPELARTTGLSAEDLHRAIYSLAFLGMIRLDAPEMAPSQPASFGVAAEEAPPEHHVPFFELDIPDILKPPPPAPAPQPAKAAPEPPPPEKPAPPPAPVVTAAAAEEVIAAFLAFRKKDAFDLLGLHDSAGMVQITRAYLKTAERFVPSRFPEDAPEGLREKAQELFLAAARAYAELYDPMRRGALADRRAGRTAEPPEAAAPKPAVPASQAGDAQRARLSRGAVIDPEALWREGRQLADGGKLREALSYFEMAAESDAQNGNYASEVAYCKYQLMLSPAAAAMKNLKNAMRIDARSGLAYFYTGKIHASLGNKIEAESYYRKAASLMPRDRRPLDAINALK